MARLSFFPAALALLLCLPALAQAQQRQNCELVRAGTTNTFNQDSPNQMDFLGGGVRLRCDRGTTIIADSAVRTVLNNRLEFIGSVRYADTTRTLTSEYLQYLGRERLIVATQNVVLTDIKTGSQMTGPFLSYYLKTETRPEEILQMPQGRPRALLIRRAARDTLQPAALDTLRRDTTVVDANLIEVIGSNRFVGRGEVEITRGTVRGFGGEVDYAEQVNVLTLKNQARILSEEYTLEGDTIVAEGAEGDQFREITSRGTAKLDSKDMNVTGQGVRIFLEEGEVNRLVALGVPGDEEVRAVALSEDFKLIADSIDALAPAQVLQTVTAVGSAYGESLSADSAAAEEPELIRNDWVRGDTIVARFTEAPPPTEPADTAGPDRVLEQLDAMAGEGEPASSLYRMQDRQAVNYLVARRIVVKMVAGEVTTVEAEEEVHGIYLRSPGSGAQPTNQRTGGSNRR
jgi:lipopolysaccharide export system protein LptA